MQSGDHTGIIADTCRALAGLFMPQGEHETQGLAAGLAVAGSGLDALPLAGAIWDDEGCLRAANGRFRQALSLKGHETSPGTSYADLITALAARYRLEVVAETAGERRIELQSPEAGWLVMDERALDAGGVMTIVTDITAQKDSTAVRRLLRDEERQWARRYSEEKARAQAASRAKTTFLAHLSHEIRTPLNHIIGFADLIRHQTYGPLGDARYLGYIRDIINSGENLLDMFSGILELAQFEGGDKVLRREDVRASTLLETVAERYAAQAGRAGLTFDLAVHTEATLQADKHALGRMIGNLLDNAIRFTPEGGRIILAMWPADDGVVVEVSDTGIGIAEDRLSSLTDPFTVPDAALARGHEGPGLGLGLAIAREIAQLSGGHLAIESSPACGTTVAVSLPAAAVRPLVSEAVAA